MDLDQAKIWAWTVCGVALIVALIVAAVVLAGCNDANESQRREQVRQDIKDAGRGR